MFFCNYDTPITKTMQKFSFSSIHRKVVRGIQICDDGEKLCLCCITNYTIDTVHKYLFLIRKRDIDMSGDCYIDS